MTQQAVENREIGGLPGLEHGLRVLVVDDSPMMCRILEKIFLEDERVSSVDTALNGKEAISRISAGEYDVCTLDVHMPGMNGLTVLKNIMIRSPLPTLMVSAFTGEGSRVTFEALRYGAVDFFQKPSRDQGDDIAGQAEVLRQKVRRAAGVHVTAARYLRLRPKGRNRARESSQQDLPGIIVMSSSTGGYSSLLSLIPAIDVPPVVPMVASLGIPALHLAPFAEYLDSYSTIPVRRAEKEQFLQAGTLYLLASDEAASFDQNDEGWQMLVDTRPIQVEHEGPVDLILLSASEHFQEGVLSMFLSGDDGYGVTGAKEVMRCGGKVMVQEFSECLSPATPRRIHDETGAKPCETARLRDLISVWQVDAV